MPIALIFDKRRDDTTGSYYERACAALGIAAEHWWLRDAGRLPQGYELYVRFDQGDEYLTPLAPTHRPRIFVAFDTHLPHSWKKIRRIAPSYDLVACCHRDAAERLRNGLWLPVACDAQVHQSPPGLARGRDVAFIGTSGGVPRKFFLQALRERYPNSFIGAADYREMGTIYGAARVGFNYSIAGDLNMRVFEVMAAGSLLVTDALPSGDLSRLGFEDRRHLVLYRTPSEAFKMIDHYLAHPTERQAIASAGQRLALAEHTYAHRLKTLLSTVQQRLGVGVAAA
ncbi:MAG: glycosyltransferase family 1 protein [Candidatus Omnitrophica bacterium]|nr:glycosyltransferase family 1 protein [Candidatus Omnitrophota bacterium]